ncbi:Hsf-type dna-binding protein, partial [Globisporangium splendens]
MQPQLVYPHQGLEGANAATNAQKTKEVAPFLKNLRQILDCENESILRWTDDGKAFEIHDMQRMSDYVLPKYFKHAKYTSFQRQLNYFNFRKWTKSKAKVCTFSNPHFVRDQPCLSWRINRKKSVHSSSSTAKQQQRTSSASKHQKAPPASPKSFGEELRLDEMTIQLPTKVVSPLSSLSFPSPTDVYVPEGDFDLQQMYETMSANICLHEPVVIDGQSLDWVDTLYSSLDGVAKFEDALPSFHDHDAFDYHV